MKEPERDIMITSRVESNPTPVAGSVIYTASCGHDVWVSPSSIPILVEKNPRLMCANCVAVDMRSGKIKIDIAPEPLNEEQIEEIKREL